MTDFLQTIPSLGEELGAVEALIIEQTRHRNAEVADGIQSLVAGNGKMLRPSLLILSARFGKYRPERMRPLAAALEMLHVSTLIHDDVIDNSPMRRGRPTLHTRYGMKDSVLIGDYLFSRCFLLAADYTTPENARRLAEVVNVICTAELEQDEVRFVPSSSVRRYIRTVTGKTAMLFSLACHVGASESGCSSRITESLRRIGYNTGIAFQIIDDILDYESTESVLRKPVGHDIMEGQCTLPMVYALSKDDGKLRAAFGAPPFTPEAAGRIVALVRERGGLDAARQDARRYTERALREIGVLPPSRNRDDLATLVRTLLDRHF